MQSVLRKIAFNLHLTLQSYKLFFVITKIITIKIILVTKKINDMSKNKLAEIYYSLKEKPSPAYEFIAGLASATHRSENSVRKWISGEIIPDINTQLIIADYLKMDVRTLFEPKRRKCHG